MIEPQRFEPGGHIGFGFEIAIELLAVLGELGHVRRCTQLRNETRGVPGGAGR